LGASQFETSLPREKARCPSQQNKLGVVAHAYGASYTRNTGKSQFMASPDKNMRPHPKNN
jgi:hypothetical protein